VGEQRKNKDLLKEKYAILHILAIVTRVTILYANFGKESFHRKR